MAAGRNGALVGLSLRLLAQVLNVAQTRKPRLAEVSFKESVFARAIGSPVRGQKIEGADESCKAKILGN